MHGDVVAGEPGRPHDQPARSSAAGCALVGSRPLVGIVGRIVHKLPTKPATLCPMATPESAERLPSTPSQAVLERAKQAILAGDRAGALALLHVLLTDGPESAATLTPVVAQALIATAAWSRLQACGRLRSETCRPWTQQPGWIWSRKRARRLKVWVPPTTSCTSAAVGMKLPGPIAWYPACSACTSNNIWGSISGTGNLHLVGHDVAVDDSEHLLRLL